MSNYQGLNQITFSNSQSQKRIEAATTILGKAVVNRLLAFVLFLMGAKRRDIAEALGIPVGTLLSLLNRIRAVGLPALEDRRARQSTFQFQPPLNRQRPKLVLINRPEEVVIDFGDRQLIAMATTNRIQLKTVLLTLLDNDLLTSAEVAQVLGYSADHTKRLARQLRQKDENCLLDKRRGQLIDYRMTPKIKAELIQQFVVDVVSGGNTTSQQITAELDDRCELELSERTVRQHIAKLGLPAIKSSLPKLLSAVKKTPDHNPQ